MGVLKLKVLVLPNFKIGMAAHVGIALLTQLSCYLLPDARLSAYSWGAVKYGTGSQPSIGRYVNYI